MCECALGFRPVNAGAIVANDHEVDVLNFPSIWDVQAVLLVESRDDVFDRLARDLAAARVQVVRARSSTEAIGRYLRNPECLLVVNADKPGGSAWLLAAKLHLTHPAARIWAYQHRPLSFDLLAAKFLDVEELIEYRGDLSRLTCQIMRRLNAAELPAAR